MKTSTTVTFLVWAVALGWAVCIGLSPLSQPIPVLEPSKSERMFFYFVMAVPLLLVPVWSKSYPFDNPRLRGWVNKTYGSGFYEGFVKQLKPMLLTSVMFGLSMLLILIRSLRAGLSIPYVLAPVFLLNFALGFLIVRVVLKKRGLSLE
jgi:hypothetical protein